MRGIYLAGAMAGCFGIVAPAGAQQAATRRFDVGVSLQSIYDSNVARTGAVGARLRGLDRADYRFTPALTVDALLPFGRQTLDLTGSAGYDFYARNSRLNRERISLDSRLGLRFGRCEGALEGNYARRQSDLADIAFIGDGPTDRRLISNTEDVKVLAAEASCGGAIGLRPTGRIEQTWTDNSTSVRQFSDLRTTVVSGGIAYRRPTFGQLTLFGRRAETTFPNRPIAAGGENDSFVATAGGATFERRIGSRLRGLVELSYTKVDPKRASVPAFSGLTWRADLVANVGSRIQAHTEIGRAIQASNRVDANYFIEKRYGGDVSYAIGGRLSANARYIQRDRDFRGAGNTFGPALVADRTRTFGGGLRFQQNRRITVTLDGSREVRDANGTIYDYKSNRVSLGLSTKF